MFKKSLAVMLTFSGSLFAAPVLFAQNGGQQTEKAQTQALMDGEADQGDAGGAARRAETPLVD